MIVEKTLAILAMLSNIRVLSRLNVFDEIAKMAKCWPSWPSYLASSLSHFPGVQGTCFDIDVRQDEDLLSLQGEYAKRSARRFFRASFRAAILDEIRGNI